MYKVIQEKILVHYQGGMSRVSNEAVDYMLAKIEDEDGEEIELYAEAKNPTEDETATYEELRAEIIKQAAEHGISESNLVFWYD